MPPVSDVVWNPLLRLPFKVCQLPFYTTRGIDHFAAHLEEILPKVTPENTVETGKKRGRGGGTSFSPLQMSFSMS